MLAAKLFGELSALVVFLVLVGSTRSSIDLYVHATYFVLRAKHLQVAPGEAEWIGARPR